MNRQRLRPPSRGLLRRPTLFSLLLSLAAASSVAAQGFNLGVGGKAGPENESKFVQWELKVQPETAQAGDQVTVTATYDINKKWYLYAPDHSLDDGPGLPLTWTSSSTALEAIGRLKFPAPTVKNDKFGSYRTLKGKGTLEQQYRVGNRAASGPLSLEVKIDYQRCDPSTCISANFSGNLTLQVTSAAEASAKPASGVDLLGQALDVARQGGSLSGTGQSTSQKDTQQRVRWEVSVAPNRVDPGANVTVVAKYTVEPGWHIYAPDHETPGRTLVTTVSENLEATGSPTFPKPKVVQLEGISEDQRWLQGNGEIRQGFRVLQQAPPGKLKFPVEVRYIPCSETNCEYPPPFETSLTVEVTDTLSVPATERKETAGGTKAPVPPPTVGGDDIAKQPLWLFIVAMIGGGLFALAMPCTYPMIPITISVFTKQAEARQGAILPLALAYGAGIIVIFNIIGWAAAGVIEQFAAAWWLNLGFCALFIYFALSFFGYYNIRLPSFLNRLAGGGSAAGSYVGVLLLGAVLVITSFTCTAPIVGSLLVLAVQGGEGALGRVTLGMTIFGATMAAPFVLLSLTPTRVKTMPRAGEWMHVLKVSLGFIELAMALKFLSNADLAKQWSVLPRELFLLIWAGLFICLALYLFNVFRLAPDEDRAIGPSRMLFGLTTLILGVYFFWGTLGYQLDPVTTAFAPPYRATLLPQQDHSTTGTRTNTTGNTHANERRLIVTDDLEGGLERAKALGRPVILNFTGFT